MSHISLLEIGGKVGQHSSILKGFLSDKICSIRNIQETLFSDVILSTFQGVEKGGLKYADLLFRETQLHTGIMHHVKSAIKDKKSLPDSKEYGKKAIARILNGRVEGTRALKYPVVRQDLKDFSI